MKGSTATTLGAVELPMNKSQTRIQPSAHESDLVVVITSSSTKTQLGHRRHLGARGSGSSRTGSRLRPTSAPRGTRTSCRPQLASWGASPLTWPVTAPDPGLRWPWSRLAVDQLAPTFCPTFTADPDRSRRHTAAADIRRGQRQHITTETHEPWQNSGLQIRQVPRAVGERRRPTTVFLLPTGDSRQDVTYPAMLRPSRPRLRGAARHGRCRYS